MKIIVYTRDLCAWCDEVKDFLKKRGIEFEERNVTRNKDFLNEMIKKSKQMFAPTIDIDGDILPDADATAVEKFLKAKKIIN